MLIGGRLWTYLPEITIWSIVASRCTSFPPLEAKGDIYGKCAYFVAFAFFWRLLATYIWTVTVSVTHDDRSIGCTRWLYFAFFIGGANIDLVLWSKFPILTLLFSIKEAPVGTGFPGIARRTNDMSTLGFTCLINVDTTYKNDVELITVMLCQIQV